MESSMKGRAKRRHLGPSECDDLVQSNTGKESLTQPFNVNLSNTDPNRGLQPRTPTKRSRQGGVGQQKGITSFFSITGVISTSPQKGTKTPVKDEEEEQEPIGHLIPQEEHVEEEKIEDYMEGITEDMLDEDFDVGTTSVKKEEELLEVTVRKEEDEEDLVEALPDAHYGLLGVQGGQEEPKGHVQDLPEEVLMEVFAHLPADDLYRNISLVCHHWRAVVMDPQFLPWKKLYCRYRKRQNDALKEVKSILDDNQINKKDDLCLLNMLSYISQFKHSKRVNVKDVLACVKGHQLYAQAEACIKDRIPDMVDNEGPNPWSAMALMLILADGVKDVLDLVALLRKSGCLLTAGGISEYLWALATLLLAMRKNDINVSNRWHYNIFYVLHLMENAPPPAGLQDNRQLITHEQQQILNHDIKNNHVVKIMAFAGTGKTTTLVKYAQQRANMRFLYLAFNKSVAMQAQRSFPYNVECSTIHSMAFRAVGVRYKNMRKLSNNLQVFDVAWVLPKGLGGFVNAKVVTQTLHNFWASVDQCVCPEHVPHKYKNTHGLPEYPDDNQKMAFSGAAQKLWDQMVELKSIKERVYNMTHDGYLKLWQLSRPQLDRYDAIFIDEAQDCTPVIMGIMLSQNCGKILVGDPHQQIYTFRGAVNALHAVPHTHIYYLTQSFRFGSEIAYIGAAILDSCKRVKQILVGGNQDGSVRGEDTQTLQHLKLGQRLPEGSVAILSRCNVTVFSEAVRLTDVNPTCKIYIVGGVENFGLDKIMDLWVLMQPEDKRKNESLLIKDYFIRSFCKDKMGGFRGLKGYAMASEDRELEAKLAVVEKYNKRIPELVKRIYDRAQKSPVCADFILGTVHKAKGLEFDTVVVTDDFMKVPCARHNLQRVGFNAANIPDDEWNLLYVAITRAKRALYITKTISNILTFTGEYFLRSGLTSTLPSKDPSLVCSIEGCENHITADAVLSMSKLPIRYMESVDAGGVLCLTCVEQRVGPAAFLLSPPERVRSMTYTNERIELPINVAMLLSLL
ncbi:F-box DNA helicase 1-like isoform X2 [Sinocyclocheilus anshuiensis]|uniref:F-box DNA helicase 1-like isoform X2 n=1 Tax=Sinocyclocheilus anshuiensis TaxID=1608454 RepID=UPI0007B7CD9E|nr:PREDICTED: F-box DNA helicase 1-like isoform X2 [Sinocyclocheilus anshuiensis]